MVDWRPTGWTYGAEHSVSPINAPSIKNVGSPVTTPGYGDTGQSPDQDGVDGTAYGGMKGVDGSVPRGEGSREPLKWASGWDPCRGDTRGEGAYVWSQPLRAAAARSSLAMTRSCNLAMRSLILRPGDMSTCPRGTVVSRHRVHTYGGFFEIDDFEVAGAPKDPASDSGSRRYSGTLDLARLS